MGIWRTAAGEDLGQFGLVRVEGRSRDNRRAMENGLLCRASEGAATPTGARASARVLGILVGPTTTISPDSLPNPLIPGHYPKARCVAEESEPCLDQDVIPSQSRSAWR